MAQIVRQRKKLNIKKWSLWPSSLPLRKRLELGDIFTPGLMVLSGLEDLVELGAEFHFWCLQVSWWFSFWKREHIFNVHQFMPSVRTPQHPA